MVATVAAVKETYGDHVLELQNYDVIRDPKLVLRKICDFLQLECDSDFLESCASIVYGEPSKTRFTVVWTREQRKRVRLKMQKYDFLRGYTFEGENKR